MKQFPPKAKHDNNKQGGSSTGRFGKSYGSQNLANAHPDVPPSYPQPAM